MGGSVYTRAELLALWVDATDSTYNQPFLEKGDGGGLEVFNQAFQQFERISEAIDNTFQSMFILPWSGQSKAPASGDRYATVELTARRDAMAPSLFLILAPGLIIEEVAVDHSEQGSLSVLTGRAYATQESIVFLPGEGEQRAVQAVSLVPGWGGNNPMPDSLTRFRQSGQNLNGTRANVESLVPRCAVEAINGGDGFIPDHVGQYLRFNSGHNAGAIRRVVAHEEATVGHAGRVTLESPVLMALVGTAGVFQVDEPVFVDAITRGRVIHFDAAIELLVIERTSGAFMLGATVTGETTGATGIITAIDAQGMLTVIPCTIPTVPFEHFEPVLQAITGATGDFITYANNALYLRAHDGAGFDVVNAITGGITGAVATPIGLLGYDPLLIPEPFNTAGWEFLAWDTALGLSVTNVLSPTGGRAAMLDALGMERNLPRAMGEDDEAYRQRISTPSDVVTPNAILRTIIRHLDPIGVDGCFREVGQRRLRGFFYDVSPSLSANSGFAWDLDFTTRPQDAWKVWLDYASFRAFFLVGIPPTGLGEFGFAYDDHPLGAYDSSPLLTFYDGFPVTTSNILWSLWNDINKRKAAGVGFEFYQEKDGCVP
jgi:hypothetical protein